MATEAEKNLTFCLYGLLQRIGGATRITKEEMSFFQKECTVVISREEDSGDILLLTQGLNEKPN